jgi:hypothetical protein
MVAREGRDGSYESQRLERKSHEIFENYNTGRKRQRVREAEDAERRQETAEGKL